MANSETVLLVTVKKVESEAVLETFERETEQRARLFHKKGRSYFDLGQVGSSCVFLSLSEMGSGGRGGSQESVRKAIDALDPDLVISVGIAFGIDEEKQSIGDVLISQRLCLYELQRYGTQIILRGDKPHASPDLINRCQATSLQWMEGAKVHFGILLTGEKLVDDVDYRNQLKALEVEAIGGEMEGAGLYVACEDKRKPWLVAKAICDWADGNKRNVDKERHQTVAARNAASFALKVLAVPRPATGEPSETAADFSDERVEDCANLILNFAYYQAEGFTIHHIKRRWAFAYYTWADAGEAGMSITDVLMSDFPKKANADGVWRLDEIMVQLALDECVMLGYLETSRTTYCGHSSTRYDITAKGRVRILRLLVDERAHE